MSQLSIRDRLVLLATLLFAFPIVSVAYLTRELATNARALQEEARLVSTLKVANAASRHFGDLKYWLTDLAVSLLVRSEENATRARAQFEFDLDALMTVDAEGVVVVKGEIEPLVAQALEAVEAYTSEQRVVGNALMAQARNHISRIDEELDRIVNRLEREALMRRDTAVNNANAAVVFSIVAGAIALLAGLALTALIVRSITRPLRTLEHCMADITSGQLETVLPPAGRDEIGTMTRALAMLRNSLVERDRLEEQRHRARAETRRAQARLSEAIETISEGFALYDAQDRLIVCNSRYRGMYGDIGVDIVPGTRYVAILRAAASAGIIAADEGTEAWLAARLERRRHPYSDYERQHAGGRWMKISERATADGGIVGVFTDITELKKREMQLGELVDRLADARDQAMQATVAKSRFLANMSHELRTPLNTIIGVTQMLQEDAEDAGHENGIEPLRQIARAGNHLLHLINDILDLSKIEAGKLELHYEDVNIAIMVGDLIGAAQPLANKNGNRLTLQCPKDIGVIYADVTRLRQIILNLLSNACKFTEKGTISLTVKRDYADGKEWIRFHVCDTGIGMTREQLGRLFQEFMQADSSTTRRYGGTGLGLAISDRLCTLMGGTISAESEPNVGTSFMVSLPAATEARTEENGDAASREASSAATPRFKNRVLVVDDDSTMRDMMRRYLAREGFDVVTAKDGAEGLALAKELRPSVVTLDVFMPGMDGWSVLKALKADPILSEIPIVMVTMLDEQRKGFALGASDYLTKPVDRAQIASVLGRFKSSESAPRALIIEDDRTTREMMRRLLVSEGWQASAVENGRAALDELRASRPELILLDLMMPEMDGFEFLSHLRETGEFAAIPVIIVTAAELTSEERRTFGDGVQHILLKASYEPEELLKQIRRVVGRYASVGQLANTDG
jgi:adenylate cyclase